MGRIFKFRVWDKTFQRMIYLGDPHDSLAPRYNGEMWYYNLQNGSGGNEYDVMQYIGKSDHNGIEIYEGDIVLHVKHLVKDAYTGVVVYDEESCSYQTGKSKYVYDQEIGVDSNEIEVAGNIYQNPELIPK